MDRIRPGPVFDTALRRMIEMDPVAACALLGVDLREPPEVLTATFPSSTLSADLLLRVGPARLVHVEYMRSGAADLVARMLVYRGLIMRTYPGQHLNQHVIVLGDGKVSGHQDFPGQGFMLELGLAYLRDLDPDLFLAGASLAPLATLCRGGPGQRARTFAQVLRVIDKDGGDRVAELLEFATVLATIRLDSNTIDTIIREAVMTVESLVEFFRDTEMGKKAIQEGLRRGLEEGHHRGLEEGRDQTRAEIFEALLHERFADDPRIPALVEKLGGWPDLTAAVHAISSASSLDELMARAAPGG